MDKGRMHGMNKMKMQVMRGGRMQEMDEVRMHQAAPSRPWAAHTQGVETPSALQEEVQPMPPGPPRAANHASTTTSFLDISGSTKNSCQQSTPIFSISFYSPVSISFFFFLI